MADYDEVIVVDFDDTICRFNEDFSCKDLVPGAREYMGKLQEAGYKLVISSARNNVSYGGVGGTPHCLMTRFLWKSDIPFDKVDCGSEGKPVAYRYIDDKAVGCPLTPEGFVDWPKVYNLIVGDS
jgi:hypothetical protein